MPPTPNRIGQSETVAVVLPTNKEHFMIVAARVVDVREDIRRGDEPFDRIMAAVAALADGGDLVIINLFEPVPLYGLLAQQGFSHETDRTVEGDWRITFRRLPDGESSHHGTH